MASPMNRHIVIAGGGTAGWMAAAALARFLPNTVRITLVESEAIGTVGVGEATIPQIRLFNQRLGIAEDQLLAATNGTIKLGIEFAGWNGPESRYIHAFGTIGRPLGNVPFHQHWLRHRCTGRAGALQEYSVAACAAHQNRFAPDLGRPELQTGLAWAYQFDAARYAALLRAHAEQAGVTRLEGRINHVAVDDRGHIASLHLDDGRAVSGDFFIDCTGFSARLIGDALGVGYEDWSRWLPCDRALAVQSAATAPLNPYTRATARTAGWQWRIPLRHRTGNGMVWCSAFQEEQDAAELLLANLDGAPLTDPRPLQFATGRRKAAWQANCVALGLASGFLEPLESTSIHLIQSGIDRLLQLFPAGDPIPAEVAEYNRQTAREWECVRDFLILHYHAANRPEPFWAAYRNQPAPDRLAHRIELFRATGRLFRDSDDLFTDVGWLQVLMGQGIMPERHDPLADTVPERDLDEFLTLARRHVANVVSRMPDHQAYLMREAAPGKNGEPN